jgi:hypothetical protein
MSTIVKERMVMHYADCGSCGVRSSHHVAVDLVLNNTALGAVLSLEGEKEAAAGSHIQSTSAVDGEFLSKFQNLRDDLERVDGKQTHRNDLDDLEERIRCGTIRSYNQLQLRLLNTTAETYQKQMEGLVENFPASQRSLQYFALVSFLIERFTPTDRAQSDCDTVTHIGNAIRHLREYFTSALSADEPLGLVETTAEAMT